MGLTIHWDFKFKGDEQEIKGILNRILSKVKDLPVEEVFPVEDLHFEKHFNEEKDERIRWMKIQYGSVGKGRTKTLADGRKEYYSGSPSIKGYGFTIWIDDGCEAMNIALTKGKKSKVWRGYSFCKTQYAVHFARAHLLVIKILDICKGEGIVKSVYDEGGFWKTRDFKILAENINQSTAMIEQVAGMLKQGFGEGQIESAIDTSKNYMSIEEEKEKNNA